MANKTILCTGGAGFVGSHLCDKLIDDNNTVICVDDFSTGSINNIKKLIGNPNFELVRHDIRNSLPIGRVDQIYHLACPASPVMYQSDPVRTIETSIVGTKNILDIAKKSGADVLFSSTSEVYGDPEEHPQSESYSGNVFTNSKRACYDEGKRCAEALCFSFYEKYHSVMPRPRIARIFNTYGPRLAIGDGRVVSNFIIQALRGIKLNVHGDGKQTRSFMFIHDLINGLIQLMNVDGYAPYTNLGNPEEKTILELANIIKKLTNSNSEITFIDRPGNDPNRRKPDITNAKATLGWEPKISLEDGLLQTIEYFKKELLKPPDIKNEVEFKNFYK